MLQVLSENESRSFRSISSCCSSELVAVDCFRLVCAIIGLLQGSKRLTVTQRLSAVFLVVDLTRTQSLLQNAFLQLLERVLQGAQYVAEQAFAAQLLLGFSQALDTTPLQVLALLAATDHNSIPSLTLTLQHLLGQEQQQQQQRQVEEQQHKRQQQQQQRTELESQPNAKHKGKNNKGKKAASGSGQLPKDLLQNGTPEDAAGLQAAEGLPGRAESAAVQDAQLVSAALSSSIKPDLLRPSLPIMPVQPGEMQWMHPEMEHSLVWDASIGPEGQRLDSLTLLLRRAIAAPLLPAQSHEVLGELRTDMKLAFRCGLTHACLPGLVAHNPLIAVEVLTWLVARPAREEWLGVLVRMDMSLHSMEVVNRLTTTTQLPHSFLPLYIHNCLAYCRRPQEKPVQNRLVRLLSVFLTSLIRHKVVAVHSVFLEVQAFCIEFSRIREAANLFRLLKQLEAGQPISETSPDIK